tara:strand:+ start:266 stop:496 length:231 start_codon:yes stop_codon:yes gene_type:complete
MNKKRIEDKRNKIFLGLETQIKNKDYIVVFIMLRYQINCMVCLIYMIKLMNFKNKKPLLAVNSIYLITLTTNNKIQ